VLTDEKNVSKIIFVTFFLSKFVVWVLNNDVFLNDNYHLYFFVAQASYEVQLLNPELDK